MKKLLRTLPADWLYQLVSLSLITSMTFYLFQYTNRFEIVREYWDLNEKLYIYTFLGIQFIVKALFYWLIFLLLKKLMFNKIKKKVLKSINEPKSFNDLREVSDIKRLFISIFGIPVQFGLIENSDLEERIEMDDQDLEDVLKGIVKWLCVFIHASITSIIVYNLNAFYIVPLLLLIFGIVIIYWYGITFLFGNIPILEKARKELVRSNSKKMIN